MNEKLRNTLMAVGGIMLLIGAATHITGWSLSPYIYIVGAILFAAMQISARYEGGDMIVRRLRRQQILGALLLVVAGFLMFITHHNEWILCLTIAAVLEGYTIFRLG